MKKNKSSISSAASYQEIGEFWDNHDLSDYKHRIKKVRFDVRIDSELIYYGLEKALAEKVNNVAKEQGTTPNTLLNLWIQEKLFRIKAL
jgi:hypothetical protein